MTRSVFLLYSRDDENIPKLKSLIQDIEQNQNLILTQQNVFQLDNTTKKIILECDIFICCLSWKFYNLKLIDTVKFAWCIARKQIITFYLRKDKERRLPEEDQNFFRYKTVEYSSIDEIREVNIFFYINITIISLGLQT